MLHRTLLTSALAALLLAPSAFAQNPNYVGQTCGVLEATFNTCIDGALVDTSLSYNTVEEFCDPIRNNRPAYFDCLCNKFRNILLCYSNSCPNDPNSVKVRDQVTAFCAAAVSLSTTARLPTQASPSSTVSPSSISDSARPTLTSSPTSVLTANAAATTAPITATTTTKSSSAFKKVSAGFVTVLVATLGGLLGFGISAAWDYL
ncbi:hypothetical protein HDU96_007639 [Phlyctochytrium bullatum]|nr:hypothetical protein HDU96_007639 [Phlyctochytrium bullatum]